MSKKIKTLLIFLFITIGLYAQNSIQVDIDLNLPRSFDSEMIDRISERYNLTTLGLISDTSTQGSFFVVTDSNVKGKNQIVPIKLSYIRNLGMGNLSLGYRVSNYSYTGDYSVIVGSQFLINGLINGSFSSYSNGSFSSYSIKENDIEIGYQLKLLESLELEILLGQRTNKREIAFREIAFKEIAFNYTSLGLASITTIQQKTNFNYSLDAKGLFYGLNLVYNINPTWAILLGYKTANLKGDTEFNFFDNSTQTLPMGNITNTNIEIGPGWSGTVKFNELLIGGIYKISENSKIRFGIQQLTTKVAYSDSPVVVLFINTISSPFGNLSFTGLNIQEETGSVGDLSLLQNLSNTNTHEEKRSAIFIGYTHNFNF